jgi:hypothetical protein
MFLSKSKTDRDWASWLKDGVEKRLLPCAGGCGERAVLAKPTGRRTGAWCRGCWSEVSYGSIPPLDKPKGIKPHTRKRPRL